MTAHTTTPPWAAVLHDRFCPRFEDAALTNECFNCAALVRPDADECADCGETGLSFSGPWHGPADCRCDELAEGAIVDEMEMRYGL